MFNNLGIIVGALGGCLGQLAAAHVCVCAAESDIGIDMCRLLESRSDYVIKID
jgi:hypothetical protein